MSRLPPFNLLFLRKSAKKKSALLRFPCFLCASFLFGILVFRLFLCSLCRSSASWVFSSLLFLQILILNEDGGGERARQCTEEQTNPERLVNQILLPPHPHSFLPYPCFNLLSLPPPSTPLSVSFFSPFLFLAQYFHFSHSF